MRFCRKEEPEMQDDGSGRSRKKPPLLGHLEEAFAFAELQRAHPDHTGEGVGLALGLALALAACLFLAVFLAG